MRGASASGGAPGNGHKMQNVGQVTGKKQHRVNSKNNIIISNKNIAAAGSGGNSTSGTATSKNNGKNMPPTTSSAHSASAVVAGATQQQTSEAELPPHEARVANPLPELPISEILAPESSAESDEESVSEVIRLPFSVSRRRRHTGRRTDMRMDGALCVSRPRFVGRKRH